MASEISIRCDNRLSATRSVAVPPDIGMTTVSCPVSVTVATALNASASIWLVARPVAVGSGDALFACQLSQVNASLVYSGTLSPSTVAAVAHLGGSAAVDIAVELAEVWADSTTTHRRTLAMFECRLLRSIYGGTYSDETVAKALTAIDTATQQAAAAAASAAEADADRIAVEEMLEAADGTKMNKLVSPGGVYVMANDATGDAQKTAVTKDALESQLPSDALAKLLSTTSSSGRLWGFEMTNVGGTVYVGAGQGVSKTDTATLQDVPSSLGEGQASPVELVTLGSSYPVALEDGYNLIYWDASAGAPTSCLRENFAANFDFVRDFTIGSGYYDASTGTKVLRPGGMDGWNFPRRAQMFGEERFPVERASGLMVGNPSGLKISVTEGVIWAGLASRFPIAGFDPSAGDTFTAWAYNTAITGGEPGIWVSQPEQQDLDAYNYNDPMLAGGLGELTENRYGVHLIYVVHDGSVHVVYGTGDYTLAQAQLATAPSRLPGLLAAYATLVGKAIVKKGADTLTSLQSPFTTQLGLATVNEHNDLSGLQGGTANEYYHLTSAQVAAVDGAVRADTGQDLLDTGRDQANANLRTGLKPSLLITSERKALMRAALLESGRAQRVYTTGTFTPATVMAVGTTESFTQFASTTAATYGSVFGGITAANYLIRLALVSCNSGTAGAGVGTMRIGGDNVPTPARVPAAFADGAYATLTLTLGDASTLTFRTLFSATGNPHEFIWIRYGKPVANTVTVYVYDNAAATWKVLTTLTTNSAYTPVPKIGFVVGTGYNGCKLIHDNMNGSLVYPYGFNIFDIF